MHMLEILFRSYYIGVCLNFYLVEKVILFHKMLITVVLLFLVRVCNCLNQSNSIFLHILAVLSFEEKSNVSTSISWIQGGGIFHGACLAAQDINKHPDLLPQFEVVPVPVLVPDCDPVKGIHKLLEALLDPSMNVIGVTGMFCDKVAEVYYPIVRRWKGNVLQVLGSSLHKGNGNDNFASYILPSHEDVAEAVISVLHSFNWTRFGIVYAQADYKSYVNLNYLRVAKKLTGIMNARYSQMNHILFEYDQSFEEELQSSEANIFVLLVPPKAATSIIQEVVKERLVWPQYVWIFVLLEPSSIILSPVWENIFFMSYRLPLLDYSNSSCADNNTPVPVTNFYDSLLYDSVWELALALNNTHTSFNAGLPQTNDNNRYTRIWNDLNNLTLVKSGLVNLKKRGKWLQLDVHLIKNQTAHTIGQYSFNNHSILVDEDVLLSVPPDRFKYVLLKFPLTLSISLYIWLALTFTLVTVNFTLLVFFRKEREVKASSVPLSMCIFVGNYLMLLSATNYTIGIEMFGTLRHVRCNVDYIGFSVGFDLVLATALMRTFRIWYIFHHFKVLGKTWADSRLMLAVIAIVSVKLFLFMLWISVDNAHAIDIVIFQHAEVPPYYLVLQSCHSDYYGLWLTVTFLYTVVLLILLFLLAIKTCGINRKDFKDTKKTILMVICQLVMIVTGGLLWGILRGVGQRIASYTSLILAYTINVFVIQVFLFLPKIFPPLHRHMQKNKFILHS